MVRKLPIHYLTLLGAIVLGTSLRIWNLDLKPLWMDEVITAIFSLGKNYHDLPLDKVLSLEQLQEIFTLQSGVSCSQIANNLATQSTHPPLFFCLMHTWLGWTNLLGDDWVAKLRLPSALFGVGAILAIYCVNRVAFFPFAGLVAAGLMAVSPFAVYLSQEARHYTLPMLFITLALLGLMQIQQDIEKRQKVRFWVWLEWAVINSISLYIHYFCILAFTAQIITLLLLIYWRGANILNRRKIFLELILASSVVAVSFLPWVPIMLEHFGRSETDWIENPQNIVPLFQTLIGWVLTLMTLPVENQPLPIAVVSGVLMLLFAIWLGWRFFKGLRQLWCTPSTHLATLTLLSFFACILLEFFAIVYLLGKDITTVPRYNFVYYPSFCALLAASLAQQQKCKRRNNFSIFSFPLSTVFCVGFLSSILVVSNLVFQKPFEPNQVAQKMNKDSSIPVMVVTGYRDYQDVALGLSFALALEPLREGKAGGAGIDKVENSTFSSLSSSSPSSQIAFLKQAPAFGSVWEKLSQLPSPSATKLNLWIIGPGRKRIDYLSQIRLSQQMTCTIDLKQHYRIGVPYQLYRCQREKF